MLFASHSVNGHNHFFGDADAYIRIAPSPGRLARLFRIDVMIDNGALPHKAWPSCRAKTRPRARLVSPAIERLNELSVMPKAPVMRR